MKTDELYLLAESLFPNVNRETLMLFSDFSGLGSDCTGNTPDERVPTETGEPETGNC